MDLYKWEITIDEVRKYLKIGHLTYLHQTASKWTLDAMALVSFFEPEQLMNLNNYIGKWQTCLHGITQILSSSQVISASLNVAEIFFLNDVMQLQQALWQEKTHRRSLSISLYASSLSGSKGWDCWKANSPGWRGTTEKKNIFCLRSFYLWVFMATNKHFEFCYRYAWCVQVW